MSEVRICDACRFKSYASEPGAPTQTTVEYETDDGDILSAEWVLCSGCAGKLTGARGPPSARSASSAPPRRTRESVRNSRLPE